MTSGTGQPKMTPAKIKKLVEAMRDLDVAEFEFDGLKVKFFREIKMPGVQMLSEEGEEVGEADPALRESLRTHLDAKSPSRAEEEHQADLFWSAGR